MVWAIDIMWFGQWVRMETGHKTQEDAEWRIALWKQEHQHYADNFRTVQEPDGMPPGYGEEVIETTATQSGGAG